MISLILSILLSAPVQLMAEEHIDREFGVNESTHDVDYWEKCQLIGGLSLENHLVCMIVDLADTCE